MAEPGGVLGEIVARKRVDVAARLGETPIEALRASAEPTRRSLRAVLSAPGARFIMEVKRASPSQGTLRTQVDPAAIARCYRGAADAVSVLVDTPYFGGSLDDLRAVRAVFDGPILAKDFLVDPRQVPESRAAGADAVLVMLSVLDDAEAAVMIAEAARFDMDVLVEAHDEAEVRRAVALGAPIIGINNRDLKSLSVDLAVTERLAHLVPADRILVAESGIESRADAERLASHADAFLVGSSLMRAPDPAAAARALAFGRVKICGLTSAEDAALARASGATLGGIIMVPGTPRAIDLAQARDIAEGTDLPLVGVFRDAAVDEVAEAAASLGLTAVQLHGSEDDGYLAALRKRLPGGCEVWSVAPVDGQIGVSAAGADRTLFDTKVAGQSGGTGQSFDWSMLADHPALERGIIAGGINPANAAAAARIGGWAIDVSSGVEAEPRRKDPAKLAALFDALRVPARGDPRQTEGVQPC